MATGVVHYTCCIIILTVFVDWGHGSWKKKDKENPQDDIALFRKMADKIEHEMEEFYDEYPNERLKNDNIDSIKYSYVSFSGVKTNKTQKHLNKQEILTKVKHATSKGYNKQTTQVTEKERHTKMYNLSQDKMLSIANKNKNNSWPKFQDILLAMGRIYDWKNDRWIKVKRKLIDVDIEKVNQANSINYHVKHKFYYRIVKLKKSKNKRNVVVAVSAIR